MTLVFCSYVMYVYFSDIDVMSVIIITIIIIINPCIEKAAWLNKKWWETSGRHQAQHALVKLKMLDTGCHCARQNGSITRGSHVYNGWRSSRQGSIEQDEIHSASANSSFCSSFRWNNAGVVERWYIGKNHWQETDWSGDELFVSKTIQRGNEVSFAGTLSNFDCWSQMPSFVLLASFLWSANCMMMMMIMMMMMKIMMMIIIIIIIIIIIR